MENFGDLPQYLTYGVKYVQHVRLCIYLVKITEVNNADCEKVEVVVARVVPEHVKVLAGQVGDHRDDWQRHQQSPEHLQGQEYKRSGWRSQR
jgi:hypothetical protein